MVSSPSSGGTGGAVSCRMLSMNPFTSGSWPKRLLPMILEMALDRTPSTILVEVVREEAARESGVAYLRV